MINRKATAQYAPTPGNNHAEITVRNCRASVLDINFPQFDSLPPPDVSLMCLFSTGDGGLPASLFASNSSHQCPLEDSRQQPCHHSYNWEPPLRSAGITVIKQDGVVLKHGKLKQYLRSVYFVVWVRSSYSWSSHEPQGELMSTEFSARGSVLGCSTAAAPFSAAATLWPCPIGVIFTENMDIY